MLFRTRVQFPASPLVREALSVWRKHRAQRPTPYAPREIYVRDTNYRYIGNNSLLSPDIGEKAA